MKGAKVNTPFGTGEVVGKESFYGGKLERILVRLDNLENWAFGNNSDIAAFFEREVTAINRT
jgi:hypothetical protein